MRNKRRKYGYEHRKTRERYARIVAAGGARCWRCGEALLPNEKWHVGHADDGSYAGPEHAHCNLVDGGRKRARQLFGPTVATTPKPPPAAPQPRWSRHWYGDAYDERCPRCRELGRACEDAVA